MMNEIYCLHSMRVGETKRQINMSYIQHSSVLIARPESEWDAWWLGTTTVYTQPNVGMSAVIAGLNFSEWLAEMQSKAHLFYNRS